MWIFPPKEKLAEDKVMINFHPKDPGVDEDVMFSANLNYSNVSFFIYNIFALTVKLFIAIS